MTEEINEEVLEDLYAWVDHIPLSRPKKDIRRDFADGVLVAEILRNFLPRLVDANNYVSSTNTQQKKTNWAILSRKVFRKLNFEVRDEVIETIVSCKPWAIENFLLLLRRKIDRFLYENKRQKQLMEQQSIQHQTAPRQPPQQTGGKPQYAAQPQQAGGRQQYIAQPPISDRPEADQVYKMWSEVASPISDRMSQDRASKQSLVNYKNSQVKSQSQQNLAKPLAGGTSRPGYQGGHHHEELVPKVEVEELEQEILVRDETIQILEAKIRRLEQLLHLKDIRLDDLQTRLERMESEKRPTAQVPAHGHPHTHHSRTQSKRS